MLVAWAASLGAMARRQYTARHRPDLAAAPRRLPPGAAFFAVRVGEQLVGLASTTLDTLPNGIRVVERYDLTLPGAAGRSRFWTDLVLSRSFTLDSFVSDPGSTEPLLLRGGFTDDTTLRLQAGTDARTIETTRFRASQPLLLPAALPLRAVLGAEPAVGKTVGVSVLDPLTLDWRQGAIRITGESLFTVVDSAAYDSATAGWLPAHRDTVTAWRLEEDGVPGHRWVDPDGYLVAGVTREGYQLERTAFELVNDGYRRVRQRREPPPSLVGGALRSPPPVRSRIAVVVDTTGWPAESLLAGGRQSFTGDTLLVQRATAPLTRNDGPALSRARHYLSPAPGIPADDPELSARARRIAGKRPPEAAAEALANWVSRNIALASSPAAPRVLTAYRARRGDAASHALLFVAMARAAGIPARTAAGVVAIGGGWRTHIWAEVWLGRWIAADPTWGQYPAEASCVRLYADLAPEPAGLFPLAARLGPPLAARTSRRSPSAAGRP